MRDPRTLAALLLLLGAAQVARAQDLDSDGVPDGGDNCQTIWNLGQDDRDTDGVGDACDNCRFRANSSQSDVGGLSSAVADGVGDACQCGDVRANGRADVVDIVVLRRALASLATGTAPALEKCPVVAPSGTCDPGAVLALRQALARPRSLPQVCAAAICATTACGANGEACPPNPVSVENLEAGVPASEWDVAGGIDDGNLLGFATNISYAPGETVRFKVHAPLLPDSYTLTIYRVGWYGGLGARRVASLTQHDPVSQPACQELANPAVCSNWSETDSWPIPVGQVSGVYLAKLVPNPVGVSNGSHILFVIRDDNGASDILFQTADTTWQAYNPFPTIDIFGGAPTSLYNGAARVSYDRPHRRAVATLLRSFWGAQLHLVRYLERNGYDVSYFAGVDAARRGSEIAEHRVWISSGHDEYWSREMRDAVEAARDAGTHLIFLSGNLMFWKTRWENAFRTLVSYKTAQLELPDDPQALTSTWRDVRYQKPDDLAEPENSTTGLIFGTNGYHVGSLKVPQEYGKLRLWRGTRAASAAVCSVTELAPETVGFEWDLDQDNGHRPPGLFRSSSTNLSHAPVMYGAGTGTYGGAFPQDGQATHHVSTYRAASGALVFNSGSVHWSHGLGRVPHLSGQFGGFIDLTLTQATANLLADMGVQAATPIDFCAATPSQDATRPDSAITGPAPGASLRIGSSVEITGTASDPGGHVTSVEVSLDDGATWQRAEGRESWRFTWRPTRLALSTIRSRAVDDSGNLETSHATRQVSVGCPGLCSIWPASTTPALAHVADVPIELGVRFRADVSGHLHAILFWADALASGPHPVHLWASDGTLLASASELPGPAFTGWHEAEFSTPVPIVANRTYVASYHTTTGYSYTLHALDAAQYRQPVAALASGGIYRYGPSPSFPALVSQNASYLVDVDFVPASTTPRRIFHALPTPEVPNHLDPGAAANPWGVELGVQFRSAVDGVVSAIHVYRADDSDPILVNLWRDIGGAHPVSPTGDLPGGAKGLIQGSGKAFAGAGTGWVRVPLAQPVPILAGATYVASYHTRSRYAYTSGYFNTPVSDPPLVAELGLYRYGKTAFPELFTTQRNYWVDVEFTPTAPVEQRMWSDATVPARPFVADAEVELGVRFVAETAGYIDGIRFYGHPANAGPHTVTLWSDAGVELASAVVPAAASCGWREARFATPIAIAAGAIHVASYHSTTGYAVQQGYFPSWSPPLRAVASNEGSATGNGVYRYGARAFPNQSVASSNYFVDVLFRASASPVADAPTPVPAHRLP